MSEDVSLTKDEAEATLLAIAEPLEWLNRTRMSSLAGELRYVLIATPKSGARYHLSKYESGHTWYAAVSLVSSPTAGSKSDSPTRYENVEEAKAACERHYATGKWD